MARQRMTFSTQQIDGVLQYLDEIAWPTLQDFQRNALSKRHCFLACVAAFHAIDRATYPKSSANLRARWSRESVHFAIVDMVAHHFKHVKSDDEKWIPPADTLTLPQVIFGFGTLNTCGANETPPNAGGIDLRNLQFVVKDAIRYIEKFMNLQRQNLVIL